MPVIDDLYAPLTYDWWWWLVLPAFVILLVAWILLSRRAARFRGWTDLPDDPLKGAKWDPPVDAAAQALARVQIVEDAVRRSEITVRDAHLELSAIVRDFAAHRTGLDVRTMTLDELRANQLGRVATLVEDFYPATFAPDSQARVSDSLTNVRWVVRTWS